jgi:hypothetical protein
MTTGRMTTAMARGRGGATATGRRGGATATAATKGQRKRERKIKEFNK